MAEVMRARSIGEKFSQATSLLFRNFWTLFAAQLVFSIPTTIVSFVVVGLRPDTLVQEQGPSAILVPALIMTGIGFVCFPLLIATCISILSDSVLGRPKSIGNALRVAIARFPPLFGAGLLIGLALMAISICGFSMASFFAYFLDGGLGALLAFLVGLATVVAMAAFWVSFGLFAHPIVLEDCGAGRSLQRAFELSKGMRWHLFFYSFLIGLAYFGLVVIQQVISLPLAMFDSTVAVYVGTLLVNTVIGAVQLQLLGVSFVVAYFDLRIRKEGFDLDDLASLVDVISERAGIASADAGWAEGP